MTDERIRGGESVLSSAAVTLGERWVWLLAAMGTTGIVYLAYVVTHPYPAYAGGLYLEIAEQIAANGYSPPDRIPGYTGDGIPFAYPPLMFYVTAALVDLTGVDPITLTRFLPGLVVVTTLVPYYGVAEELLGDPREAGLATVLFGLTPTVLRWHLSAGGLVRAPAFLLALSGVYTGIRLFRTRRRVWLVASTVIVGLLALTHPTYSVFLVLSVGLIYLAYDRTVRGFVAGVTVGVGGLLIAAPWLAHVGATHGFSIFGTAAGTHGGLGGGLYRLGGELAYALDDVDVEWPFFVAAYLGGADALRRRRFFLPVWLVTGAYVIGKGRFIFVAGSMLSAVFVFRTVVPRLRRTRLHAPSRRTAAAGTVLLVILGATTAGTLYAAGAVTAAHERSDGQPQYMDDSDRAAMRWIEDGTPSTAAFVAVGDAAEWLPYFTDRRILVGPWGVEWERTAEYYHQMALYDEISACGDAACLSAWMAYEGVDPDYVYVPLGEYTVRGREHVQSSRMLHSLVASPRYDVEFVNEGVVVARVVDDAEVRRGGQTVSEFGEPSPADATGGVTERSQ